MLTPELQNEIDEKWNACWPLSQLRPIVILDLVSYLFFVKKISSDQPTDVPDRQAGKKTEVGSGLIATGANGKKQEIIGDFFNDPDDKNIYTLFSDENGIIELEKAYLRHESCGVFIKGSLLMHPTSKLLETALGILKILKDADHYIKGEIFGYLLNKAQYVDANGQAYLPAYLVNLLVAIIRPGKKDVVLNPTLGNGNILVSCAKFMAGKASNQHKNNLGSQKLKGLESDLTSLRIGAMNLLLNGISSTELKVLDIFAPLNAIADDKATVILSNLIFLSGENNMNVDAIALRDAIKKDIYYLEFILENLCEGARCAVVVPGLMLYHTGSEFTKIRKEIIDNFTTNALISIDDKNSPEFNGASILVFSKESSVVTDKVWFYKIKHDGTKDNEDEHLLKQTDEIATHFKNSGKNKESDRGFYVDADEIRAKNYNFSFSEYNSVEKEQSSRPLVASIKPGDFPKLGHEVIGKSISHLQPSSRAHIVNKLTASLPRLPLSKLQLSKLQLPKLQLPKLQLLKLQQLKLPQLKLPELKKVFNKELFNVQKIKPAILLKKLPVKKMVLVSGVFILLIAVGYLFYSAFFSDMDVSPENKTSAAAKVDSSSAKPAKTSSLHSIDSVVNSMNSYLSKNSANDPVKTYTVISKAFFYSSPNIGSPEGHYVTSAGNYILIPLKEENGFVYVNYINRNGNNANGWLNKNDLEEIGDSVAETIPVETQKAEVLEKEIRDDSNGLDTNSTAQYLVKTKAYFYRQPDINTRRNLYLNKPNQTRLSPIEEKNGFVFVIYSNTKGETTRGWLNKKDLEVVEK